jgi:hypothetical protein
VRAGYRGGFLAIKRTRSIYLCIVNVTEPLLEMISDGDLPIELVILYSATFGSNVVVTNFLLLQRALA